MCYGIHTSFISWERYHIMEKKANHFSGQLGFVLAAAGSAVGVGNLWRFPYLAAKDGGGLFLIIYLVLVLTFGFTLRLDAARSKVLSAHMKKCARNGSFWESSPSLFRF